ncbi:MAG: ATP-binding protein [Acidobacteriota bacterium]
MVFKESLFAKILMIHLISAFVMVAGLNTAVIWYYQSYSTEKNYQDLLSSSNQITNLIGIMPEKSWTVDRLTSLVSIVQSKSQVNVCLVNQYGLVIYNSSNMNPTPFIQTIKEYNTVWNNESILTTTVKDSQRPDISYTMVGREIGTKNRLILVTYHKTTEIAVWMGKIVQLIWWIPLFVLLLTIPAVYWLTLYITKPLQRMETLAREMSTGNLDCQMEVNRFDEVGRLAQSFNNMAADLARVELQRQEFLANVSHELRTPLTSIKGFVQALLDETIPASQQGQYLSRIYSEAQRLSYIVGDLLDIASLSSGKFEIKPESSDLWGICREVVEGVEPLAHEKSITLDINLPLQEAITSVDQCRISQILVNLLDNAVKYTTAGGTITIQGEINEEYLIHISDQGPGIAHEELAYLFERFYRGKKNSASGTGLGLTISRLLAEAHNGRISVESAIGKGSTFTLHLPKVTNILQ